MGGLLLDRTASVWRTTSNGSGGYALVKTFAAVRCAVVPISSFDSPVDHAYEATHILWVEPWLELRKEDEVRWGRRLADAFGNVQPWAYVVQGLRTFRLGGIQTAYYVREKD